MKRTLFFAFCILHFTFAAPAPAQTTTFLRAPAAAAYSPLDNSPDIVYANHRPGGADSSTAIWEVYGRTSTTTYDVWDIDPGTSDIKTSSGGSWTTISEVMEVTKWYDFGSADLDAAQATSGNRPLLSLNATSNGYPEVVFDGTDDYLATAATTVWGDTQHSTWMVVAELDSGAGLYDYLIAKGTGNLGYRHGLAFYATNSGLQSQANNGSNAYVSKNSIISTGTLYNIISVFDGTQSTNTTKLKIYLDNSEVTGLSSGGTIASTLISDSEPIYIGNYVNTSLPLEGKITNVYIHDSDSHDATERGNLNSYFGDY